jgi:PAS domain S-box-containing protein
MIEPAIESSVEVIVDLSKKGPIRVLHVDDEPSLLKIAKQCLEMQGSFQVDTASSVEEAMEKMKKEMYDAVVSDYAMPGKDGSDFLKELRDARNDIPFIMFTGKGKEEIAIRALNLGADGYFSKIGSPETVYGELAHSICQIVESKKAKEVLRTNESYLRAILGSMFTGLIVIDEKTHKIFDANFHALETIAAPREDVIGKICHKFICPAEEGKCPITDLGQTVDRSERVLLRADGQRIPILKTVTTIIRRGRKYLIESFVDITERKKAERELFDKQTRLQNVFDTSPSAILVIDLNGKILDCNERAQEIFGYPSKSESVGRSALELVTEEDRRKAIENMERTLKQGLMRNVEYTIVAKDGSKRTLSVTASVLRDGSGNPTGFVSAIEDITERKKGEELLRESEEKFRGLFESMQDPVGIFVGREGRLIGYNTAFKKSSGYTDEELKSKVFLDFVHPDDHAMVLEKYQTKYSEEELPLVYEIRGVNKRGESIPLELSVSTYKKKGRVIGIEVIHRDITERKRYEERLSALNTYSRDLNMAENREEIYRLTLDAMQKVLGFEYADFFMIDKSVLCIVDQRGYPEPFPLDLPLDGSKKGITIKVAKTGNSVIVQDVRKNTDFVEGLPGILSELAVPIKAGQKTLGILNVEDKRLNAFDEKDQELLEILASHAATAISNLEYATNLETYAREIRESQQRFERLFMDNPEAAVYLGPDSHILDINPCFEKLFEYNLAEIKGKHINEVVVPKDKMEEAEMLDRKAVEGYVYHDTVRRRKDGSLVPVSISAAPIIVEGRPAGSLGMYKDISELKRTEAAIKEMMQKLVTMNEKLRVVGSLARHDVRNKLSVVTGNIFLTKRRVPDNSEVLDYLHDIDSACQQILEIFDFAHSYEMLGDEELKNVDVEVTVEKAVSLFSDLKGVKVSNECQGLTVLADSLLARLFYNLIDNSLKYGEKITQIRVYYDGSGDGQLKLIYQDDGSGIPLGEKRKLFREGYGKGTGYGLYLIKKMMEVYGWTIQETGEPGKGAQFTITVPRTNEKGKENYQIDLHRRAIH